MSEWFALKLAQNICCSPIYDHFRVSVQIVILRLIAFSGTTYKVCFRHSLPNTRMDFCAQFLMFQTMHQFIQVFGAKVLFRKASRLVSGGPRNAQNSDFVKDVLKKSTFKQFAFETSSKPLQERFWVVLGSQISLRKTPKGESTNAGLRSKHCR